MTSELTIEKSKQVMQFWHDQFAPFNTGRDFVVLFGNDAGKPSMALLQLDGGDEIKTGGLQPVDLEGNAISVLVKTKG